MARIKIDSCEVVKVRRVIPVSEAPRITSLLTRLPIGSVFMGVTLWLISLLAVYGLLALFSTSISIGFTPTSQNSGTAQSSAQGVPGTGYPIQPLYEPSDQAIY